MLPRGETSTSYLPEDRDDRSVDRWLRTNAVVASAFTAALAAVLVFGGLRSGAPMLAAETARGSAAAGAGAKPGLLVNVRSPREPWRESAADAALMRP